MPIWEVRDDQRYYISSYGWIHGISAPNAASVAKKKRTRKGVQVTQ